MHTAVYKADAIKFAMRGDRTIGQVAEDLVERENERLRKENESLRLDREIQRAHLSATVERQYALDNVT